VCVVGAPSINDLLLKFRLKNRCRRLKSFQFLRKFSAFSSDFLNTNLPMESLETSIKFSHKEDYCRIVYIFIHT